MHRPRLAAVLFLCIGGLSPLPDAAAGEPRAIVELFTSQGCSSCPAADKLLGELATDDSILALSLPIDYWDYLGWKDTLARPRHSARQRGYAGIRGDREVYTPQAVVNGALHVLGSDRQAIQAGIRATQGRDGLLSVPVKLTLEADGLAISVTPANELATAGEAWLCTVTKAVPVPIARGENRGRTVTYHNVVRRWVKLGSWSGGTQTWTVPRAEFESDGIDAVAVLLQAGSSDKPGTMLGAAFTSLR